MSGSLTGRWALVTGAASGIGRAIAIAFAREGANVIVADKAEVAAVVKEIARSGVQAVGVRVDISRESEVLALFDKLRAATPVLDILVNNAGILVDKPLLEST